jgi:HSP20 family protein
MQEQVEQQAVPINIYSTHDRLKVMAPMPGLSPENNTVSITVDDRLLLPGALRAEIKEHDDKKWLFTKWQVGSYAREVILPLTVNASCANVSYGNGVLLLALPLSEREVPGYVTLKRVAPARGQYQGNAGYPPTCVQAHDDETR